jgi:enoyl-CoA hydratase/carnithine racemase
VAYETIRYAEDGPVGTITLNRPAAHASSPAIA